MSAQVLRSTINPWTRRSSQVLPARIVPRYQKPYPEVVYFKDLPVTNRRTGQKGFLTVRTLPASYLQDTNLIREGTELYNHGWNPEGNPRKAEIFHINERQFVQAATNSPGGVIASFLSIDGREELVGAIWSLQLEYPIEGYFWKSYDEIVTPDNYFGKHDSLGNSKHCMSVVVKRAFNRFQTDEAFPIGSERRALSIGQMEVLAQRVAARRSPYVFILFADSRPSSLREFLENEFTALEFDPSGRVLLRFTDGSPVELLADRRGLYVKNKDGSRNYLLDIRDYLGTYRAKGRPFDQMVAFHGPSGLGARPFRLLPLGRIKALSDQRTVMDEDSVGFNIFFKYDIRQDFPGFMTDLLPAQQLFVRDLARYLLDAESFEKSLSGKQSVQVFKLIDWSRKFEAPAFQKTVLADAFSIEKARFIRGYLRSHPEDCRAAAEFKIT